MAEGVRAPQLGRLKLSARTQVIVGSIAYVALLFGLWGWLVVLTP
jgi:hypothetical protein